MFVHSPQSHLGKSTEEVEVRLLFFLGWWFSTFLMLSPLNTVPHVVATPSHKIIFIATS